MSDRSYCPTNSTSAEKQNPKCTRSHLIPKNIPCMLYAGACLLSPLKGLSSAQVGLTSEFGMGSGVTPPTRHQHKTCKNNTPSLSATKTRTAQKEQCTKNRGGRVRTSNLSAPRGVLYRRPKAATTLSSTMFELHPATVNTSPSQRKGKGWLNSNPLKQGKTYSRLDFPTRIEH